MMMIIEGSMFRSKVFFAALEANKIAGVLGMV